MNIIEKIILENINQEHSVFVFPTQMACNLWADKIITDSEITAVAMERFVAWDVFKNNSIKSTHQDKTSIPSEMRRFFSTQIIEQNKQNLFFKSIINPEYAKNSSGFVNWISKVLPSLFSWKTKFEEAKKSPEYTVDSEDEDLMELFNRYKSFLDKNSLFDPAWEIPPFKSSGNHYFIFFPEILSDYFEYEQILSSTPDITLILLKDVPTESIPQNMEANLFRNSRLELKNVALYIKNIHETKKIPYNQIALNVPDLESYGPFLEKELDLFQIPYAKKASDNLLLTTTGNFFMQIFMCVQEKFSFNSVRNLLLNDDLPWKSKELNISLIEFGKNNNCVCGFYQDNKFIDSWEESFRQNPQEEILLRFYSGLKTILTSLVNSKSFAEINRHYFEFKRLYFSNKFLSLTDKILSRCLTKLSRLIDLENSFNEAKILNPYSFFLNELQNEQYLSQNLDQGLQILPYKMGATAPFKLHIIVDSSQASLSVIYKQMDFLRADKIKKLYGANYEESNLSENFIKLYALNSEEKVFFTVAEKKFNGFSQVSSDLIEKDLKKISVFPELQNLDSYNQEKLWYLQETQKFPDKISLIQKNGFENWKYFNNFNKTDSSALSNEEIIQQIKSKLSSKDENSKTFGKLRISQSQMKYYFECPRNWLNKSIFGLENQKNEAEFIDNFAMGEIYHNVLDVYFKELKKRGRKISFDFENNSIFAEDSDILHCSVNQVLSTLKKSFISTLVLNAMVNRISEVLFNSVNQFSNLFKGCEIYGTEIKLNSIFPGENFYLQGVVDCVLFDPDIQQYFIIDFKSSSAATPTKKILYSDEPEEIEISVDSDGGKNNYDSKETLSQMLEKAFIPEEKTPSPAPTPPEEKLCVLAEKIPDFQMPSYVHLLEKERNLKISAASFFTLNSAKPLTNVFGKEIALRECLISKSDKKATKKVVVAEDYKPTMIFFYKALHEFAKKIEKADIQISDKKQIFSVCSDCDYKAICRRTFQISKNNDL